MEIYGVVEGMEGEEAGACQGYTQWSSEAAVLGQRQESSI